jgi:hypothetical protein
VEKKFYKKKWFIGIIATICFFIVGFLGICLYANINKDDISVYQSRQKNGNIEDSLGASAKLAVGVNRNVSISIAEDNKVNIYLDLPKTVNKKELLNEEVRVVNEIQKTKYKDYVAGLTVQHLTDWNNKDNKDITAIVYLNGDKVKGKYDSNNIARNATLSWIKDGVAEY